MTWHWPPCPDGLGKELSSSFLHGPVSLVPLADSALQKYVSKSSSPSREGQLSPASWGSPRSCCCASLSPKSSYLHTQRQKERLLCHLPSALTALLFYSIQVLRPRMLLVPVPFFLRPGSLLRAGRECTSPPSTPGCRADPVSKYRVSP